MAFDHAKFLARFVEEAREHCSRIGIGLLNLEKSPGDPETLNGLFRAAHTVKGAARMMKLGGVAALAHRMEDVLDAVRGGRVCCDAALSDLLLRAVDTLSTLLDRISSEGVSGEAPEALCEELSRSAGGGVAAAHSPQALPAMAAFLPAEPAPVQAPSPAAEGGSAPAACAAAAPPAAGSRQPEYYRINAEKLDDLIRLMGEIVSEQGRARKQTARLREIEHAAARFFEEMTGELEKGGAHARRHEALRGAGQALQLSLRQTVAAMADTSLMQDHLTADLQETSLALRMLPIATVFDSLRRTVREVAREQGKEIDFIIEGGETELDRKIIERIGDPLMHMIRNSLDHGLEYPAERVAAGKAAKGSLVLCAFYDSGCVTLSLRDDGRGISVDRIREKALARGIHDADTLAAMTRSELTNLIFLPGFSTSAIITDLSGRGVGMDVVRKNVVDELKGSIAIETEEGKGTTFLLRLPLNLAVFPLVLVSVGGRVCALPATSVCEMLAVAPGEIIEIVNRRAIRVREQLIPVEELSALLDIGRAKTGESREELVVIIRDGDEKMALIVDELHGREEMVVKPLPGHLKNLPLVSGVSVGDGGSLLNVLQVPELFRLARNLAAGVAGKPSGAAPRSTTILVVDDSCNTREIEKSILEAYGYGVVTAEDGEEAFEKTRTQLYDLVITDVEMPRLDGFSLTERLRGDERYRNVPVIIVTSREKDEDKKRGIMVGADAYIVKGAFDQSNLLDTVRNLIG